MSNVVNKEQVERFLAARYPASHDGFKVLWSRQQQGKTEFFSANETDALIESIAKRGMEEDLYLPVGLQREKLPPTERGKTEGVVSVSGLFADIDTQIGKETDRGYCRDNEEALAILRQFKPFPSIVVNSGNGLQAHWLLDEPVSLETADDRERVQAVFRAFQKKLRGHFAAQGKTIDSVHDLARVFRIPGTFNHKGSEPKPVAALEYHDKARYGFSEIEALVQEDLALERALSDEDSDFPLADHNKIVKGCSWYSECVKNPESCSEPNWYAAASITCRCENGRHKFHAFSRKHPKYTEAEANQKFDRGFQEAGPRTCKAICEDLGNEAYCKNCPHFGKITSPIQLGQKKKKAVAARDQAVKTVLEHADLFHDVGGNAFMTIKDTKGSERTYIIGSSDGKNKIKHLYFQATGRPLNGQTVNDIVGSLEAMALYEGPCQEVFLREGSHGGNIYIDLGDDAGFVVCITPDGWEVRLESPIKFLRPKGYGKLPIPNKNGNVHLFREALGLSEETWTGLLAYMVSCAHPSGPYFHLMIEGEHGSGKSFTTSCIKRVIDPAIVLRTIMPKNERDMMVIANTNRLLSFDNLSQISGGMSDVLCTLATGGGLIGRKLFSDGDPFIMNCTRPVTMNGITSMIYRPDLMNRTLPIFMPTLPEGNRKPEMELQASFDAALPRILGGLYTILSAALHNMDKVQAPTNIRMADCAQWLCAAEPATGLPKGSFVEAIVASQRSLVLEQMATHPAVVALFRVLRDGPYDGTLGKLHHLICGDLDVKDKEIIGKTATAFSNRLKRLKSSLEAVGIEFSFGEKNRMGRMVRFWLNDHALEIGPEEPMIANRQY